jgi:hypothetical protein
LDATAHKDGFRRLSLLEMGSNEGITRTGWIAIGAGVGFGAEWSWVSICSAEKWTCRTAQICSWAARWALRLDR